MKKILSMFLAILMIASLAACANTGNGSQAAETNSASETSTEADTETDAQTMAQDSAEATASEDSAGASEGNVLVVYFSWSGNLDKMAHWVTDETGGDLFRVTAKDPYPEDYDQTADRAKQEQDDGVRPEIVVDITEEQIAQYDTVFFGFPVWWYDLPMSMWTFLESYDFSGKTIIPFFSHEGSSNGADALPTVEKLAAGAIVRSDDALSIRGGDVADSEEDVRAWVQGLR